MAGRLNNTEYEWYVDVDNGENSINGPTWSFTTEPATLVPFDVYLCSNTSATAGTIYPNVNWGMPDPLPPGYPGTPDNDWDFTAPIELYIVPEVGSVFGASDITIQWDNTMYSYVGVENSVNL